MVDDITGEDRGVKCGEFSPRSLSILGYGTAILTNDGLNNGWYTTVLRMMQPLFSAIS